MKARFRCRLLPEVDTDRKGLFDDNQTSIFGMRLFVCSTGFSTAIGGWLLMKPMERYTYMA